MDKNSKKSKCPVQKTLVRNVEVKPPRPFRRCVDENVDPGPSTSAHKPPCKPPIKSILKKHDEEDKFSKPKLNTINKISRQIEAINRAPQPKDALVPSPSEMLEINKKVGAKLNFHMDEAIYKDLVALNVAESRPKTKSKTPAYVSTMKKDIEPNLEDFYEDKPIRDKPIMVPAVNVKTRPVSGYDGTELFRKFKEYES